MILSIHYAASQWGDDIIGLRGVIEPPATDGGVEYLSLLKNCDAIKYWRAVRQDYYRVILAVSINSGLRRSITMARSAGEVLAQAIIRLIMI